MEEMLHTQTLVVPEYNVGKVIEQMYGSGWRLNTMSPLSILKGSSLLHAKVSEYILVFERSSYIVDSDSFMESADIEEPTSVSPSLN
jgi:hypothetical protein